MAKRRARVTDELAETLAKGGEKACPIEVEALAAEVQYLRNEVRSALFSIRGWITCQFPITVPLDGLGDDTQINGVRAGPLKSAKLTCDEVINRIDGPKSIGTKKKAKRAK